MSNTLMAACMLCRQVPKLQYLPGWRKGFAPSQSLHIKAECKTGDQDEKKKGFQHQELSSQEGYRLHYSPSSYHQRGCEAAKLRSQTDDDDDEQFSSPQAPAFWQQSNRYSVSCSRHLSSSKNTLLDLAFNKVSEPERPPASSYQRKPVPPDVKVDSRAFHKCRPEYASFTLDLTRRPQPIEWVEVLPTLRKVTVLKGRMKPSDVCQFLMELSKLHPEKVPLVSSDQRFIMLLRYSVEHLRLFSQLQLLEVLQSFVWLDMPSSHTVLEVYEAELSRRASQMTLHQLLLAADLWRCIGRQVPQFLRNLYDSVQLYLGQIGVPELVQLLYIIGEGRHCPKDLIHPLEQLLMRHLKQLHPEEVGSVCLGLFKSQTSISEGAVTRVVDGALSLVAEMSDFAMVNVLKYLRFSYLYHRAWLEAMTREVPRRARRMGVKGLMHVALTCSALHYYDDIILSAIAARVPSLVPHCRSKDSCKLLWAYGSLGFLPVQSPSFYPSLTEALRQRKAEFQRFPEHLLTGLLGLVFVSQFPEDLLALALSPEFVNLALKCRQLELKKDLFTLDGAVALELPQWSGPRLSCELKEEVAEMLWKFAQADVCQKREVVDAEAALQDLLGGEKFVCKRMILPHTRSIDLEVHLDSAGQPVPVNLSPPEQNATRTTTPLPPQGWEELNTRVTITDELLAQLTNGKSSTALSPSVKPTTLHRIRPDGNERLFGSVLDLTSDLTETLIRPRNGSRRQGSKSTVKIAVQVSSRNHYCSQSQQLLGLHAMKRRHLQLAGFKVVELSYQEWAPMLRKSRAEKLAYLHCKIYNSL